MKGGDFILRITFLDGTFVDVSESTPLIGINNVVRQSNDDSFYLSQGYNARIDKGLSLGTFDERLGITGFLLSFDCFALSDKENETIYMRSAVKSISVI